MPFNLLLATSSSENHSRYHICVLYKINICDRWYFYVEKNQIDIFLLKPSSCLKAVLRAATRFKKSDKLVFCCDFNCLSFGCYMQLMVDIGNMLSYGVTAEKQFLCHRFIIISING